VIKLRGHEMCGNGRFLIMKIGVIGGTGGQGLGIAIRFVQSGEDVIIGSKKTCKDAGIRITGIDPECRLF